MKNKLIKFIPLAATLSMSAATIVPTTTSCSCTKDLYDQLLAMPRVAKVDKLDDMPGFEARYMVWFKHPVDWKDESKGYFNQRVELNFRGKDRVNQLFTCGYELRDFVPNKMNDFEIGNRYCGNIIKPEYRFFDESIPEGLSHEKLEGWEYLTNSQAMEDFHSIITAFKTVLTGKWAFSGTSKGGETTNCFAMTYPNDCDVYVPYVAPAFYARDNKEFLKNVYTKIGNDVLGETIASEYRKEISKLQWFALKNRNLALSSDENDNMIEGVWNSAEGCTFTEYANQNHDYIYYLCVVEFATGFWQYDQDIKSLREFNAMPDGTSSEIIAKARKCIELLTNVAGITGYALNGLFFPYETQACREMGEYHYSGEFMINSIVKDMGVTQDKVEAEIDVPPEERENNSYYWRINLTEEQYNAWVKNGTQDMTLANKMQEWNNTCTVPVIMVFGGADTWYELRLPDNGASQTIKRYVGKDASNANGRTHKTRISTLAVSDQKEIWNQLDSILTK